jgi:hypothetical protein
MALRDLPGVRVTSIPDVRGWDVELDDGHRVGRVDRLMLDLAEKEVRYFDVALDAESVTGFTGGGWNVLVPIGRAQLDHLRDVVRLPGPTREEMTGIPDTPPLGVTRSAERLILRWFGAQGARGESAFYANEAFRLGTLMAPRRNPPAQSE